MNTPIKHPPRPQPQVQSRPAQPQPLSTGSLAQSDNRGLSGAGRRSDAERLRALCNAPAADEPLSADGLFFSQLLVTPVSQEPQQSGYSGSGFSMLAPSDGVPTQLIDELAERLPAQPDGPFSVTLLMPTLGKVQVNASKRDNQWTVELGFARRSALKRVQPHQRACEEALARALGHDVELSLNEELQA